jgi:hypothetical protein
VVATIYRALGVDLDYQLPGPQGRPITVADTGTHELRELF